MNKITGLSSYRPFVFLFKPVMHTHRSTHTPIGAHTRTLILLPYNMCSTSKLSRVQRVRLQRLYSLSLLSHQLNFKQGRFIVNGDFCNFFVSHSAVSKQVDILECHFSEVIRSKMRRQKKVKVLLVNEWKSCCKSSKHLPKSQQAKVAFNGISDPAVPRFDCDEGNLFQARA